ncbi:hypothetical protein ACFYS8_13250 [Kitasatospora sp. NPDC004615]|uniref:hypothetical protein n=1 Tax=unclassified Kitasatospora TaxID=2633591 RepID=UPI0036A712DF
MNQPTGALQRQARALRVVARLTAAALVTTDPAAPAPRWEFPDAGDTAARATFDGPAGLVGLNAWREMLGDAAKLNSRRTPTGMAWALTVRQDGVTVVLCAAAAFTRPVPATSVAPARLAVTA